MKTIEKTLNSIKGGKWELAERGVVADLLRQFGEEVKGEIIDECVSVLKHRGVIMGWKADVNNDGSLADDDGQIPCDILMEVESLKSIEIK